MKKYISSFFKMLGFLILYYLIYEILNGIFNYIFKINASSPVKLLEAFLALISSIILVFIFIKSTKNKLSFICINSDKKINTLLIGITNGLIYSSLLVFILLLSGQINISSHALYNKDFISSITLGIICTFIFVTAEEIIYRGCLLSYFKDKFSPSYAIIITSIFYAVFSVFNTYTTVISFVNNFLFSCILSVLVIKNKSVVHAIGVHFSWNLIVNYIFSLNNKGTIFNGIFNFNNKNIELLNGGSYGPLGGLIFTLSALVLLFTTYKNTNFKFSRKNVSVFIILIIFTLFYAGYDIKIWYPEKTSFDNTPQKIVSKYDNANNYLIDLNLDTINKKLSGTETIDYINTSDDTLHEIYFHMYAAAFSKYHGGIKIESLTVNDNINSFYIEGNDKTLLHIPLKSALVKGNRVKIIMKYVIDIPERSNNGFADRFAYSNNAFNLGNCLPIAAVYENGSFDKHPYDEKGDAFYSETGNYSVLVSAPSDYTIASCGTIDKTEIQGKIKKWYITSDSVRDFAFVASNKLSLCEGNVNGTIVKSYAFNKFKAQKALNIACDALKIFNKRIGEYPYGSFTVVETDLGGGMEYPGMVMLLSSSYDDVNMGSLQSKFLYGYNLGEFEFVLVHEIAHQWWYGLIGDDEFNEPYVDEPLAQFSSLLYLKDKYGEKTYNTAYDRSIVMLHNLIKPSVKNTDYKRPLNKYSSSLEYNDVIYNGVTIKIKEYYDKTSDNKFNEIMQETYKKYKFKILKGKDYPIPLD